MTQQDLDFLKKYLDVKVAHCNISEIQAQDIYDVMRINCSEEPITEEELDRLAEESNPNNPHGDTYEVGQYFGFQDGFKTCYYKLKGE